MTKAKDSDELEHLQLKEDSNILRVIATNSDHEFMVQNQLEMNTLTGSLFEVKEEEKGEEVEEETQKVKSKA